jgi:hypothetical protein
MAANAASTPQKHPDPNVAFSMLMGILMQKTNPKRLPLPGFQ